MGIPTRLGDPRKASWSDTTTMGHRQQLRSGRGRSDQSAGFTFNGVWGLACCGTRPPGTTRSSRMEAPKTSGGYSVAVGAIQPRRVARHQLRDERADGHDGSGHVTRRLGHGSPVRRFRRRDGILSVHERDPAGHVPCCVTPPPGCSIQRSAITGSPSSTRGNPTSVTPFAIQPSDGKFLVAGYSSLTNGSRVCSPVSDQRRDRHHVRVQWRPSTFQLGSSFHGLAVQSDGKIVAVGGATSTSGKTTTNNFLIARFQGDTTPLTEAARPRASDSTTAPHVKRHAALDPARPPTDQDLTALAAELIAQARTARATGLLNGRRAVGRTEVIRDPDPRLTRSGPGAPSDTLDPPHRTRTSSRGSAPVLYLCGSYALSTNIPISRPVEDRRFPRKGE